MMIIALSIHQSWEGEVEGGHHDKEDWNYWTRSMWNACGREIY